MKLIVVYNRPLSCRLDFQVAAATAMKMTIKMMMMMMLTKTLNELAYLRKMNALSHS